jgi:phosphotransferase system, enzyme I, PtsP
MVRMKQEPSTAWQTSRRLMKNLRAVMASSISTQEKLDTIVRLIAAELVAEVCSLYVRKGGDVLELSANLGFKVEAIHHTRLRVGEGLVGLIAATKKPVSLSQASQHPAFVYRPETGEDMYQSLLGVHAWGKFLGFLWYKIEPCVSI